MALTTAFPSKATSDVIAFGADGSARTSGWTFHGGRPAWSGLGDAPAAVTTANPGKTAFSARRGDILALIRDTATRHQQNRVLAEVRLDPRNWQILFQALIETESSYNPAAVSPKGAYGLGQLMPDTARALGVDAQNISQNLDGAARYLLAQLAEFQDIDLALAAYNAGPHRVAKYSGVPPFAETRTYIARIHRIRSRLSGEHARQPTVRIPTINTVRTPVVIALNSEVSALE